MTPWPDFAGRRREKEERAIRNRQMGFQEQQANALTSRYDQQAEMDKTKFNDTRRTQRLGEAASLIAQAGSDIRDQATLDWLNDTLSEYAEDVPQVRNLPKVWDERAADMMQLATRSAQTIAQQIAIQKANEPSIHAGKDALIAVSPGGKGSFRVPGTEGQVGKDRTELDIATTGTPAEQNALIEYYIRKTKATDKPDKPDIAEFEVMGEDGRPHVVLYDKNKREIVKDIGVSGKEKDTGMTQKQKADAIIRTHTERMRTAYAPNEIEMISKEMRHDLQILQKGGDPFEDTGNALSPGGGAPATGIRPVDAFDKNKKTTRPAR